MGLMKIRNNVYYEPSRVLVTWVELNKGSFCYCEGDGDKRFKKIVKNCLVYFSKRTWKWGIPGLYWG